MLKISTIEDISSLKETCEIECKLAIGKNGKGQLPKDFWASYSAFANSGGGYIFLGLEETKENDFKIIGIQDTQKVINDLWDLANNKQKVSCNLLQEKFISEKILENKKILIIHIPRATRLQKPVFINGNPLIGTYKRQNTGDYQCDETTVRRMLAEQTEDSRDSEIIPNYNLDDLDAESLKSYRNLFATRQPDHPWNQLEPHKFLRNIGGWKLDRESGTSGLTKAGLLMFGELPSIQEVFPNYMLDYQERPEAKTEARWVDRYTLDGTWSGNLFDFYRQVIKKLTSSLKVPFKLKGDNREDNTPVHEALREALVNTLVHADFSGRSSLLVVKRPDMFGFRNPGLMRVPTEIAVIGGESDCRNRNIHKMFRLVGLGEQAGSGVPKIYSSWKYQHWRKPSLVEKDVPSEQTLLELHMLDLIPEKVIAELREYIGEDFDSLCHEERLILVTASIEETINHARLMEIIDIHPHDLTMYFSSLTEKGFLKQSGKGKGTIYFLPITQVLDDLSDLNSTLMNLTEAMEVSSGGLEVQKSALEVSNKKLSKKLHRISEPIRKSKKSPKEEVEKVILKLCQDEALTIPQLEGLLGRTAESLRKGYLQPLIKNGKLRLLYPTKPSHPKQAYISKEKSD